MRERERETNREREMERVQRHRFRLRRSGCLNGRERGGVWGWSRQTEGPAAITGSAQEGPPGESSPVPFRPPPAQTHVCGWTRDCASPHTHTDTHTHTHTHTHTDTHTNTHTHIPSKAKHSSIR